MVFNPHRPFTVFPYRGSYRVYNGSTQRVVATHKTAAAATADANSRNERESRKARR